jgi:SARP family transcriptional regulator, regulator of embCAB operon
MNSTVRFTGYYGEGGSGMLQFKVMGPLEVLHDGRDRTPTPPKVRQVLALLLLRANQVVAVDALIEEVWGEDPPLSAVGTMQTYIHQLRKLFERPGTQLMRKPPGYLMAVPPSQLDAHTFEMLSWQGRQLLDSGRPEQAGRVLRQALAMWTGPCLANVVPGRLLEAHAVHLEEQRMRTLELRIQADAEIGLHRDLVGEMRSLVMSHPLNEWFHGQLIVALSRSGRRGEALQAYQNLRELLCNQLGLEPQPDLQLLQREVLSNGIPESAVFRPYRRRLAAVVAA